MIPSPAGGKHQADTVQALWDGREGEGTTAGGSPFELQVVDEMASEAADDANSPESTTTPRSSLHSIVNRVIVMRTEARDWQQRRRLARARPRVARPNTFGLRMKGGKPHRRRQAADGERGMAKRDGEEAGSAAQP